MTVMRASDPSQWCFAEIDENPVSDPVDRLLAALDEVDEPGACFGHPAGEETRRWATVALGLEAIEVLESTLAEGPTVVPAGRLVEAVLEVWELADDVDPAAAAPMEALLNHLVARHHTTIDEVTAALSEARRALSEARRALAEHCPARS